MLNDDLRLATSAVSGAGKCTHVSLSSLLLQTRVTWTFLRQKLFLRHISSLPSLCSQLFLRLFVTSGHLNELLWHLPWAWQQNSTYTCQCSLHEMTNSFWSLLVFDQSDVLLSLLWPLYCWSRVSNIFPSVKNVTRILSRQNYHPIYDNNLGLLG